MITAEYKKELDSPFSSSPVVIIVQISKTIDQIRSFIFEIEQDIENRYGFGYFKARDYELLLNTEWYAILVKYNNGIKYLDTRMGDLYMKHDESLDDRDYAFDVNVNFDGFGV